MLKLQTFREVNGEYVRAFYDEFSRERAMLLARKASEMGVTALVRKHMSDIGIGHRVSISEEEFRFLKARLNEAQQMGQSAEHAAMEAA